MQENIMSAADDATEKAFIMLSNVIGLELTTLLRAGQSIIYTINGKDYQIAPNGDIYNNSEKLCIIPKYDMNLPIPEIIISKIMYLKYNSKSSKNTNVFLFQTKYWLLIATFLLAIFFITNIFPSLLIAFYIYLLYVLGKVPGLKYD